MSWQQDWSLSEVMRKAAEHFVERFPQTVDPLGVCVEAETIADRGDASRFSSSLIKPDSLREISFDRVPRLPTYT